jgi:hypothetical protein
MSGITGVTCEVPSKSRVCTVILRNVRKVRPTGPATLRFNPVAIRPVLRRLRGRDRTGCRCRCRRRRAAGTDRPLAPEDTCVPITRVEPRDRFGSNVTGCVAFTGARALRYAVMVDTPAIAGAAGAITFCPLDRKVAPLGSGWGRRAICEGNAVGELSLGSSGHVKEHERPQKTQVKKTRDLRIGAPRSCRCHAIG